MSFEKFGTISYTKETRVSDFVKYLEEGTIVATRCKKCGKIYFPPRSDCANCLSKDFEWKKLSGRCKLVTYSVAYFAPIGFEKEAPYTLALAELDEGIRAFSNLSKNIGLEEVKIGMHLRLVPKKLADGKITLIFEKT